MRVDVSFLIRSAGVVLLLATSMGIAGGQPQRRALAASSSTMIVSPVAVATWVARHEGRGPADAVDLVVIWRGDPGWFARAGRHTGSAGGSGTAFRASQTYGDVTVDLQFDFETRTARINGRSVRVGPANVILVDGVGSAKGPAVVGTLTVDGTAPSLPLIGSVLARSPEIVNFLQCDRVVEPAVVLDPTGPLQAVMAGVCDSILHPVDASAAEESRVRAGLGRYAALVIAGNHAGVAALFAADGEIVNPGQNPVSGRTAIQAFLDGFAEYRVLQFDITASSTTLQGDTATQTGRYAQRVRAPDGKIIEVAGRFAAEWVRAPSGAWQIRRMTTLAPEDPHLLR